MKSIANILVFLLIVTYSFGQEFTSAFYKKGLNIKLSLIDEKRIDKAVELLLNAQGLENDALEALKNMPDTEKIAGVSSNYVRSIRKLHQASGKYYEGHSLIYNVYSENCQKFVDVNRKMEHYASGVHKAKYYEQKGKNTIEKALSIREVVLVADKPEWIQYKMHEALELEKLAVRDKGRALNIYLDFPVEYNYDWEDDVTTQEVDEYFRNPVVNVPSEEVFKKKPEPVEIPKEEAIIFRVQIAAHIVQIAEDEIRTFYSGEEKPIEVYENRWFKYQIGSFDNFADAYNLQKECRVPRAFVVAYQNNVKLSIKDALKKIREAQ